MAVNPQEVQKLMQALGGDAYAKSMFDSSQAAGNIASQNTMEDMNSKGILNSTVTADRVAQVNTAGMNDIYGKLLNYKNQKDQQAEDKRRYEEQMALKRQQMAGSGGGGGGGGMNKYDYQMLQDSKDQQTWNNINKLLGRRGAFKSNADYLAQLEREGAMNGLGPGGYDKFMEMYTGRYGGAGQDLAGQGYLNTRRNTSSSQPKTGWNFYTPEKTRALTGQGYIPRGLGR